ncbi:hypothetical protein AMECASPLE_037579 [Ameca splendens]|uniref:Uncharacterized protein n=1 Tax=Ameca splendens TaxID=208324 RepID=A0ABV0ZSV5_9TELE
MPRPACSGLFLCAPHSKTPTGEPTNRCFAITVLLDLLQLATSWLLLPFLPLRDLSTLHRSSGTLHAFHQAQLPTKGLSITAGLTFLAPTLFSPAQFPLLLAVYQQRPTVTALSGTYLFL